MRTADLDQLYEALGKVIAQADFSALSFRAARIGHIEATPGIGLAGIALDPSPAVLDFQARLIDAAGPFTEPGGTAADYEYHGGTIVRSDQVLGGLDLGAGKPEHIFAQTGRLPAFAGGNADVDIEMLESAKFALLISHDDAAREFAYTKAAEKSLVAARELGWTIVSMKDDWATVFAQEAKP